MSAETPPRYLALVLNGHLPWVIHHGTWPQGSDWLFETAAGAYLPLYESCARLFADGLLGRLTLALSPSLVEQWAHPSFKYSFVHYLEERCRAAEREEQKQRAAGDELIATQAAQWQARFHSQLVLFRDLLARDLIEAFRALLEEGAIEIISSAATHAPLPLLGTDELILGQLVLGRRTCEKYFGAAPAGVMLPECAYRPGGQWEPVRGGRLVPRWRRDLAELVRMAGYQYFIVDSHLADGGATPPAYPESWPPAATANPVYRPAYYRPYLMNVPEGPAVFVRDPLTGNIGKQDLPPEITIDDYTQFVQQPFVTSLEPWSIPSGAVPTPGAAGSAEATPLAEQLLTLARETLARAAQDVPAPLLCAVFGIGHFGSGWFEGPLLLEEVVRRASQQREFSLVLLSDYLRAAPPAEVLAAPAGSWSGGADFLAWNNSETRWMWPVIYELERELMGLLPGTHLPQYVWRAALRQLLLLTSSDWLRLVSRQSGRDYAEERFNRHAADTRFLLSLLRRYRTPEAELTPLERQLVADIEERDSVFEHLAAGDFMLPEARPAAPAETPPTTAEHDEPDQPAG